VSEFYLFLCQTKCINQTFAQPAINFFRQRYMKEKGVKRGGDFDTGSSVKIKLPHR